MPPSDTFSAQAKPNSGSLHPIKISEAWRAAHLTATCFAPTTKGACCRKLLGSIATLSIFATFFMLGFHNVYRNMDFSCVVVLEARGSKSKNWLKRCKSSRSCRLSFALVVTIVISLLFQFFVAYAPLHSPVHVVLMFAKVAISIIFLWLISGAVIIFIADSQAESASVAAFEKRNALKKKKLVGPDSGTTGLPRSQSVKLQDFPRRKAPRGTKQLKIQKPYYVISGAAAVPSDDGVTTGFNAINDLTNSFEPATFVVRPRTGKLRAIYKRSGFKESGRKEMVRLPTT